MQVLIKCSNLFDLKKVNKCFSHTDYIMDMVNQYLFIIKIVTQNMDIIWDGKQ